MNHGTNPRVGLALLMVTGLLSAARAEERRAPDPLSGPPFVTCRGWAIGDGKTGELLWGESADVPMKAASTTKVACAYVVLTLAERDPAVMREVVTFSKFADETAGSTSGVRAGERVTVEECLYGLLLPSGNDAGNALAEHFNARFAPAADGGGAAATPRSNFVAEMNRAARRLGMKGTTYRIPYGDGGAATDGTTTPRDLLTMTHAAMQLPAFRKYVATVRHEGRVTAPDGTDRAIVWENTNQLLKVEGYDGVKTGTTTQAGSCLVASCHRGDDHLISVVLGAASDAARYADTRNLLRWAWLTRGHRPELDK